MTARQKSVRSETSTAHHLQHKGLSLVLNFICSLCLDFLIKSVEQLLHKTFHKIVYRFRLVFMCTNTAIRVWNEPKRGKKQHRSLKC